MNSLEILRCIAFLAAWCDMTNVYLAQKTSSFLGQEKNAA